MGIVRGSSLGFLMKCLALQIDLALGWTASYTGDSQSDGNLQIELHELIDFHDGSFITASVAVVWRTENCNHILVVGVVVASHYELMGSSDSRQAIRMVELFWNVLSETVPCASYRDAPSTPVVRVRPKQIADGSLMRHFLYTVQLPDLVQSVDTWWKTAVQAKDLVFDHSSKRQKVEQLCKNFPNICISVLPQALIVKAVTTVV